MKQKLTLLIVTCLFAFPAVAQQLDSTKEQSNAINQIIQKQFENVNPRDQRVIQRHLNQIENILTNYSFEPEPDRNLICDSNNNKLIDLNYGEIHDFSSATNCQEAKQHILNKKPFCDYQDNTLRTEVSPANAVLVHDFSSATNCQEALLRVAEKKNFCDYSDNTLRSFTGKLIYDFSSATDCKKAMNQ